MYTSFRLLHGLIFLLGFATGAIATLLVVATFLALSGAYRDAAKCAAIATNKDAG